MNVGELRKYLAELNSNDPVVVSGSDHSYRLASVSAEAAEIDLKTREMWEYYDEGNKNKKSNRVINVVVIQ